MKYKDRVQVKNGYKKTLLVTTAALTLGMSTVGTFGGAISAYAAEEQTTSSPKKFTLDADYNIKFNENIDLGNAKDLAANFAKLSGRLFLDTIVKGNESGDALQNALRDFSIGIVGMIPYGGSFVSSILGVLWPVAGKSQIQIIMEKTSELIDQKIEVYDGSAIRKQLEALQQQLQTFEDSVNNKPISGYYSAGDIQESNRIAAIQLQGKFIDLLKACQKDGQKESELPLFTVVATAHLQFLKFMEKNSKDFRIQMDDETLSRYFTNTSAGSLETISNKYQSYITETAHSAQEKVVNKAKSIKFANHSVWYGGSIEASIEKVIELEKLSFTVAGLAVPDNSWINSHPSQARKDLTKLRDEMGEYNKATIENAAFKIVSDSIMGSWQTDAEGQWYYVEKSGVKATGWKEIQGQWYYLKPEDGAMFTGLHTIGDKLYYLKLESATSSTEAPKGAMLTGWKFVEGAWFYFNPEEGDSKGAAVTGWKQINSQWYYLDPDNEGVALTSTTKIINGKKYNFDASGVCTNP